MKRLSRWCPVGVAAVVGLGLLTAPGSPSFAARVGLVQASAAAAAGISSPIAGGGSGDGGSALASRIQVVSQLAVAPDGSIVFAEPATHSIRRISLDGTIRRIAGDGQTYLHEGGFSGDGGPATAAKLSRPEGVQVDADGVVYIADTGNRRIRRISTDGTIDTIAGTGGVDVQAGMVAAATSAVVPHTLRLAPNGDLYFTELGEAPGSDVRRLDSAGQLHLVAGQVWNEADSWHGNGLPATTALLGDPADVLVGQDGLVYIASLSRVLQIDGNGVIRSVAGVGSPTFSGADAGDGGPADEAWVDRAYSIAFDAQGRILVPGDGRIRRITVGGVIEADRPTASPPGVLVRAGDDVVYATEGAIERVGPDGSTTRLAGTADTNPIGDGLKALDAYLGYVTAIGGSADGSTLFADSHTRRVWRMDGVTGELDVIAGGSAGATSFSGEGGLATDAALMPVTALTESGGALFIASSDGTVRRVKDGVITTVAGTGTPGSGGDTTAPGPATALGQIDTMIADGTGGLLILDSTNGRVRSWRPDGTIRTVLGGGSLSGRAAHGQSPASLALVMPSALAVGPDGTRYVTAADISGGSWLYEVTSTAVRASASGPAQQLLVDSVNRITLADSSGVRRLYPDGGSETLGGYHPRLVSPVTAVGTLGDGRLGFAAFITDAPQVWAVSIGETAAIRPSMATGVTLTADQYSPAVTWTRPADPNVGVSVVLRKGANQPARSSSDGGGGGEPTGMTRPLWVLTNDEIGEQLTWGSPYTMSVFTYDKTTGTTSAPIVQTFIARRPVRCTTSTTAARVTYGTKVTVTGKFVIGNEQPAVGLTAAMSATAAGRSPVTVAVSKAMGPSGSLVATYAPDRRTVFTAWRTADTYASCTASLTVNVAPAVTANVAVTRIRARTTTTLSSTVAPAAPGQRVSFQMRSGTTWKHVAWKTLDRYSRTSFPVGSSAKGTYVYRMVRFADTTHVDGVSRSIALTVY